MGMHNGVDTVLNLEYLNAKDNNTHITEMMVGSEPAKPKEGPYTARELRGMLESFREKVKWPQQVMRSYRPVLSGCSTLRTVGMPVGP